ncbi:radical SAM protein [Streptomyces sp. UNOC14_S4]|uniref:radical SAM protein n=1 Tax=Streptomyces sp. UNOC14_S4 TaxID=2872340 RepID=UPI001E5C0C6E|nr:radical SAM protein [Streptomyces sp. UNOC14_S4]MCC3766322.1 radical SAM protein [Streptomyces sp. UNOC14_S4]
METISPVRLKTLELEITGGCQLACTHCYASSSPQGTHGSMTLADWTRAISEAAGLGIPQVQLIGGEPTLHPRWVELVDHALGRGLAVEIYSNLFHVGRRAWDVFARDGVTLATSYYSDRAEEHDRITTRPGSHARTRANIVEACRRGIVVRAGVVGVLDGQRVQEARAELGAMGVVHVRVDRQRAFGRADGGAVPDPGELCGRCGTGRVAVLSDGSVCPCAISRFMACGNVKDQSLADVLASPEWRATVSRVPARAGGDPCDPDCLPALDGADCAPAEQQACDPAYADIPDKK